LAQIEGAGYRDEPGDSGEGNTGFIETRELTRGYGEG
jgi:hypothetical protein